MRRRLYTYLLLLAISIVALTVFHSRIKSLSSLETDRDFPKMKEEGMLRIAIDYNTVDLFVEGDSLSGFQYQIARHLSNCTSLQIEVVPMANYEESVKALMDGSIDILARSMPITETARQHYLFSRPIQNSRLILIQRTKEANEGIEPLRNQLELARRTICLPSESPYINRLKNLSLEIGDSIFIKEIPSYGTEQLAIMVASHEIDYTVCDHIQALKLSEKLPLIDIKTELGFDQQNGWMLRKSSPILLDSLNHWLNQLDSTGVISLLSSKYFTR